MDRGAWQPIQSMRLQSDMTERRAQAGDGQDRGVLPGLSRTYSPAHLPSLHPLTCPSPRAPSKAAYSLSSDSLLF